MCSFVGECIVQFDIIIVVGFDMKWFPTSNCIVYIKDLDKLNLIWQFDVRFEPIFTTTLAAAKNTSYFKSSQSDQMGSISPSFYKQLLCLQIPKA